MAVVEVHITQAVGNLRLARHLVRTESEDPIALQWCVTLAFYCAVHCVEAYRAAEFGEHSIDHADRDALLRHPGTGIPQDIRFAYRQLKTWSSNARYLAAQYDRSHIEREVFPRIERIATYFGLPGP